MPDSRPSGLTEVLSPELASLYESIVIPVDDPSYSDIDVKKIKVKTLLQALSDANATNATAISGINTRLITTPTNNTMATAINNGTDLKTGTFLFNPTNASAASISYYQRNKIVCINGSFTSRGGDGSHTTPLEMAYCNATDTFAQPPKSMYFTASIYDDRNVPCVLKYAGGLFSIGVLHYTEPGTYYFNLTYVV